MATPVSNSQNLTLTNPIFVERAQIGSKNQTDERVKICVCLVLDLIGVGLFVAGTLFIGKGIILPICLISSGIAISVVVGAISFVALTKR